MPEITRDCREPSQFWCGRLDGPHPGRELGCSRDGESGCSHGGELSAVVGVLAREGGVLARESGGKWTAGAGIGAGQAPRAGQTAPCWSDRPEAARAPD